jgi:two-component system, NarL family, response regulator NreC
MSERDSKTITVLIADDHPIVRAGIHTLLAQAKDIKVIGEPRDGFEVKKLIPRLRPQILLLDLKMPGPRPYEIEKWIREEYPEVVTLVLTSHDRDAYLATMMEAGVAGYLSKEESAPHLIDAIRRAAEGSFYFSDEQIAKAQKWKEEVIAKWKSMTKREQELLQHLAVGEDNKAIAKSLSISRKTVEFHITNILKKLNMNSRDEVIVWMLEHHPDDSDTIKD